ncbi:hypothetical protein HK405_010728, partial [Cladochytrium tenue]
MGGLRPLTGIVWHQLSLMLLLATAALQARPTRAYCANGRTVVLSGASGSFTDGSAPFAHSRPGSNCSWAIPIPSAALAAAAAAAATAAVDLDQPLVTVELSHWELNPLSRDHVDVAIALSGTVNNFQLGSATGHRQPRSGPLTFAVTPRTVAAAVVAAAAVARPTSTSSSSTASSTAATASVVVRFVTDAQSPQFDGFFASWWTGTTRVAGCPNACWASQGRGTCGSDNATCQCAAGFS